MNKMLSNRIKIAMQGGKRTYIKPECEVIHQDMETFICASVTPSLDSTEVPWNPDENNEGGSIFFGDPSTISPAKKHNIWEEE